MKSALKHLVLFMIFGAIYVTIELVYRGYSHWTMFIVGGLCGICVGILNEIFPWHMPIWAQAGIGAVAITVIEFISGVIFNIWFKWEIWDYSNTPLNILGQVCLPFALIWYALAHVAIVLDDYLRYWFFNEEKPHYILWFNRK